ncbi:hypothetical protein EJ994_14615 [Maribacter sp. MJ134]|uniref:hypothetical protein n=1 Tax=Maribacter sp. MJ134 TaxID=2496865 RepID=UPI000F84613A|nr:hypothetical protein [Maribacter sp. MJ134]AZQ59970.1 hypothetical protein EJ994_14615 [Maribacter sp. MJ134]
MAKKFFFAFIIANIFLVVTLTSAQNPFENETEIFSNAADAEKIYLQLSGTTFNNSETIWFKAIVTDVFDHKPTTKSSVLHVELIDPLDNRIVDKNLLKISGGLSSGFFQLYSSYTEGKYIIRAYTEWNKNFGSDFISSVPIQIYQLQKVDGESDPIQDIVFAKDLNSSTFSLSSNIAIKELDTLHTGDAMLYMNWKGGRDSILLKSKSLKSKINIKHSVPIETPIVSYRLHTKNEVFTKSVVLNDEYGSLQFFPEGGSLIGGLQSVMGFKFLDYKGKGTEIEGTIVDGNGVHVADFKSNILGMGKVTFIPESEQTYYGILRTKSGTTFKYKLPAVREKGQVLSLIQKDSIKELRIWNKEKNQDSLFVKFFSRGKNLFLIKARFGNGMFSYKITPKNLPQGVIGLTVFDKFYRPIAERHFFNEKNEENLSISVEMDRDWYSRRDSAQVAIITKFKNHPVSASVSVMAVDSSFFCTTNLERKNIISYFLLQSDIKGEVENPSYYFESNKNLSELDYLMLTQGWTNYKYRENKKPRLFNAQKGLEVTGTVTNFQKVSKRDESNKNRYELNMLVMGEPMKAYVQETDSLGRFKFTLGESYGLGRNFVIQPTEVSNKIDDLKININKYKSPEISYEIEKLIVPIDSIAETIMTKKIREDIRLDPILSSNTIALNEVVVSDYKITPERANMVELHGIPDVVIENDELVSKQEKWTNKLYRWLLFNYPEDIRVKRFGNGQGFELAYVHSADWTYVVIDGIPVHEEDYRLIGTIPVRTVKSAEIIRNTATANRYHSQVFNCYPICPPPPFPAILAIYTYSGQGLNGAFPKIKRTNLINDTAPQYSVTREYYSPEYHEPSKIDWSVPDRRTLLYWKPDILTNSNGEAKTTFFNGDISGKMMLIVEGFTSSGHLGYSELSYEIDKP